MKLILIYGPPASGKLTVANELTKRINYVVLHNHKTLDLYKEVMEFGTKEFWDKVSTLRFELIETAAESNRNLITTLCYEPGDEHYVVKLKQIVEKNNSQIFYVRLICNEQKLKNRVTGESRKSHGKIKTVEEMESSLSDHDYNQRIDEKNSIEIENTNKSPEEVADIIMDKFNI